MRLSFEHDEVLWRLEPSGCFSTGSLYKEIFKAPQSMICVRFGKQECQQKLKSSYGSWLGTGFPAVNRFKEDMAQVMACVFGAEKRNLAAT